MSSPSYSPRLFRAPCASLSIPSARIHSTPLPSPLRAKYGRVSITRLPNAFPAVCVVPVRVSLADKYPGVTLAIQVAALAGVAVLAGVWGS